MTGGEAVKGLLRAYGPLLAFLLGLYVFYRYVLGLILPFAVSAAIAILIDPAVNRMQRRLRLPRGLAVGLTLAGVVGFVFLFLFAGVGRIAEEARLLAGDAPLAYARIEANLRTWLANLGQWTVTLHPALQDLLDQQRESVVYAVQVWLRRMVGALQGWLTALPDLVAQVLVVALATFFISRDKAAVRGFLLGLVPEAWREQVDTMARRLTDSFVGFTTAMFVLILLTALATTVGLAALGARYALLLGVVAGLLDVLPVLGPGLLFVPWSLYHVLAGDFVFGLGLLVLWGLVSGVRTVLQAQVIGDRIGLHPLSTLLALYAGVKLFGAAGFILGPLTAVLLKATTDVGLINLRSER